MARICSGFDHGTFLRIAVAHSPYVMRVSKPGFYLPS